MARPAGVRNQDFEQKKQALIEKLVHYLLGEDIHRPSFRQIAIAAGTSEPTLRHYFGDRSGLIVEVIKAISDRSEVYREAIRQPQDTIDEAITGYFQSMLKLTQTASYARAHAFGIREGMCDSDVQEAYLKIYLQPNIDAVAERLLRSKGGPETFDEARHAAFLLISVSLSNVVHQKVLNGEMHQPIDQTKYFERVGTWLLNRMSPKTKPKD